MDREQIEIKYLEILNQGGNPMDDVDIRRAVEEEPALRAELESMGSMIDALADASLPEGDAPMDREPIDAIVKAFEEGLQQGRRADKERPARRGLPAWIPPAVVAATVTAFVIGAVWQHNSVQPALDQLSSAPVEEQLEKRQSADQATPPSASPEVALGDEMNLRGGRKDEMFQRSLEGKSAARDMALDDAGDAIGTTGATGNDSDRVAALVAQNSMLQQTVAVSMLESGSPAKRMQGIEYTAAIDQPDAELIDALGSTLRNDKSVTVRLATAEALNRYGSLPTVRQTIIDALLTEKDPLVQLQLIDLLMDVHDAETLKALRSLEQSDKTDAIVRQRVEWALKESR
jgi:hypothetical protein